MILPWQAERWEHLGRMRKENRLPHALLLSGPAGVGKRQFAQAFAQLVLCQATDLHREPCGHCHSCHLMQAKSHPDFFLLQPEEEGQMIKIDAVRELKEFIQQTSHQGGYRVVLIQPATAMNMNSANALLKTLEEPTPGTLILLVSDQRAALPVTITSRCHKLRFPAPLKEEALQWLQAQNSRVEWNPILESTQGAPLLAKQWQEEGVWPLYQNFIRDLSALSQQTADPLQLALQWKEYNLLWLFDLFFQWLLKLLRAQQGLEPAGEGSNALLPEQVKAINLLEFADYLQRLRAEALGPFNLNQQLLLESLFIRWAQYASR